MTTYFKDLAERTVGTWAVTFVGLLVTNGFDVTDLAAAKAAAVAAFPAALAVVYGALAKRFGNPLSAGFTDTSHGN